MASEKNYQAELDGLRALAVMAVLLCHLDFRWIQGGFVGVDVFFVLSGFLITRLIAGEIAATGRFNFGNFYVRRIRRLYPALLTTVILTWIGAFLLLAPWQMRDFANSAIAALLSYANVQFYLEADYFDALAQTKPLLHTWSLSVEEQFYLLWPPLLLVFGRFLRGPAIVVAVALCGLLSLGIGLYWLGVNIEAAFYLLPSRVVELVIGALLVWLPPLRNRWLINLATLVGLAAMIAAMLLYRESTPFPGLAVLLPCAGAALFIIGANSQAAAPFRLAPIVWLGRISYSLYLVHWPIIVLWLAYSYRPLEGAVPWILLALSVGVAWLQYRLIEQPFRRPLAGRNWPVLASLGVLAVIVSGISVGVAIGDGWSWRVPEARIVAAEEARRPTRCGPNNPDLDAALFTCQNFRGKDRDLFVWGDSHALHLRAGLADSYPDYNVYILHIDGCVPQSGLGTYMRDGNTTGGRCVKRNLKAFDFFTGDGPARNIIVTSAKRETPALIAEVTRPILGALRSKGHVVAFVGDFMRPGVNLADCEAVPDYLVSDEWRTQRCVGRAQDARRELTYNKRLKSLIPEFISPSGIQCPKNLCRYFDGSGRLLFRDDHHLNDRGSRLFVGKLKPLLPFD